MAVKLDKVALAIPLMTSTAREWMARGIVTIGKME